MNPTSRSVVTVVGERRRMPRYHLLTRLDIVVDGCGDAYWGSMLNLSRNGVAATLRHHLKPYQRVTVRFHHQSLDAREIVEDLAAQVIWQYGDNAGLEFDPPLTADSPALQRAQYLVAHLIEMETGR
jgi:hypothetical protein